MSEAPPPSRPDAGRMARWLGLGLVVCGAVGALVSGGSFAAVVGYGVGILGAIVILVGQVQSVRARRDPRRVAGASSTIGDDAKRSREIRIGWESAVLGVWAFVHWPVSVAIAIPFISMGIGAGEAPPWWAPVASLVPDIGITVVLSVLVLTQVRRTADGTEGRARALWMAIGGLVWAFGATIYAAVVAYALSDPSALAFGFMGGEIPIGSWPTLWESILAVSHSQGTEYLLLAGFGVAGLGGLIQLGGAIAAWFLVPRGLRAAFWYFADAVIALAFVAVTLLLPLEPPADAPDAVLLPSIRLTVTTIAALRVLFRLLPLILDGTERIGFRLLVAARMMRARKSGFLTMIGGLSILAVSVSTCVLTLALSVMGGFRNDLKQKILGNNAHVVVDKEHGTFEGWLPTLERTRGVEGVVAATPYVQGEVMITSATNLAGAVIRGIDPDTIGDVTELEQNLRHGRLEYLRDPERLLRLRADEMRRGLLAPPMVEGAEPGGRGSIFDDVEQVIQAEQNAREDAAEDGGDDGPGDPELERIEQDIEEFLLPTARDGAPATDPGANEEALQPDVLPGLIVGQELARTLRLHVGDEVNVVSPFGDLGPSGPMPKTRPFRIAGIFYSGMYEFDMKMAYTTLGAAQGFLNVGDAITGIEAKVDDTDRADEIALAVEGAIARDGLRVRSWQEVNRNLFGALNIEKLAMFILLGFAILVASFCIVATLTLMVQEKGKEVGVLKAMGASNEQIIAVFMAQGLMIGLLGAATGLGMGYVFCFAAEHFALIHLNPEVYYIDKLPVHIDPTEFVFTGIAAVLVCLLATIYPAILGSRVRPVEAMRYS